MKTLTEQKLTCARELAEHYEGLLKERRNLGATYSQSNIDYHLAKIAQLEKQLMRLLKN